MATGLVTAPPESKGAETRLKVEGMDCASCVAKLETALSRVPDISLVAVNFAAETVTLQATNANALEKAQATIRVLGYRARILPAAKRPPSIKEIYPTGDDAEQEQRTDCKADHHVHSHAHDRHDGHILGEHDQARRHDYAHQVSDPHAHGDEESFEGGWWRSGKARVVFLTGALLAAAFAASVIAPDVSRWAYIAAALVGLVPFARRAIVLARLGSPFSIETLMSVAAIGALAIGEAAEAAIVVFLFAVGELLENVAAGRARAGIKALIGLVPRTAIRETFGGQETVPANRLEPGDVVIVRPGDRVPGDGEIIEGASEIDESPVTGESVPVSRAVGDQVMAGSVNASAVLRIRVTRPQADNTLSRIIRMVEEAQSSKAPTARFIDSFAAKYTPAAMAVALLVIVVPPLFFGADWSTWVYRGLAVLLIACPCALVISTPAAITSGIAAGARRGLLIKGGAALEAIGNVKTIAFDKTGTLTAGKPRVTDVVPVHGDDKSLLLQAASVEQGSSHPLAQAILDAVEADSLPKATESKAIAGKAVEAIVNGRLVAVGSPRYAAEQSTVPDSLAQRILAFEEEGKTAVVVLADKIILGVIALRDEPRGDAAEGVARLQALDVEPVMLTGDNRRTGHAIAKSLGLDVRAELMPADKLIEIERLKALGGVAMVGDGINDAPALAEASVGIAMGGGTDVALETADAALLKNSVVGVAELVALSRATLANIRQNVAVALGLKGVFLVTTLIGATSLWMAILADTGATVLVTLNALRLLRRGPMPAVPPTKRPD